MKIIIETKPPKGRKTGAHLFGSHLFWAAFCYFVVELVKTFLT